MGFGYLPRPRFRENLLLRMIGYPSIIRRIQAPVLVKTINVKEGMRILDAGCGIGYFTAELARKNAHAYGIDISLSRHAGYMMAKMKRLYMTCGNIERMPFNHSTFDAILLSSVLQVVENDWLLLRECRRVLKKNAYIVLSVPVDYRFMRWLKRNKALLRHNFNVPGRAYYDFGELVKLLTSEGFKIEHWEYSPKAMGSFIYELVLTLTHRFKLRNCERYLFLLVGPVLRLDRYLLSCGRGNEIIVKAIREN